MSWYVLGIDNGLKGYVCLLKKDTGEYKFIPTPVKSPPLYQSELHLETDQERVDYDVKNMYRIAMAANKVAQGCCVAIIEDAISTHSGGSRVNQTSMKSRESLSRGRSTWAMACELADISPVFTVAPSRWESQMGLRGKDKSAAVELAKSYGVVLPQIKETKSRVVESSDAADAYLLAKWFSMQSVVANW